MLDRFIEAHKKYYDTALKEIKNGKKDSHWIWFIFPQLAGMGYSYESYKYGIISINEAKEYYNNKYLGGNLIEISNALLELKTNDMISIVGPVDYYKIKSCMTLFYLASHNELFKRVLDKYYDGKLDEFTIKILEEFNDKEITNISDYEKIHLMWEKIYDRKEK